MIGQTYTYTDRYGGVFSLTIGEVLFNDGTENYKTNQLYDITGTDTYPSDLYQSVCTRVPNNNGDRYCLWVNGEGGNVGFYPENLSGGFSYTYITQGGTSGTQSDQGKIFFGAYYNKTPGQIVESILISTNIPLFETYSEAAAYYGISDETARCEYIKEHALNYSAPEIVDDDTSEYYIYNRYNTVSISRGIVTVTNNTVHQLNERILYNGSDICLYRDSTNPFLLSLKMGSGIVGSYFSNTETISDVDYSDFVFSLEYSSPFYSTYDRNLGVSDYSGYMAIGLSTNIPVWDSESDADDFLAGNKDISESSNWDKISNDPNYSNIISNLTEQPEVVTEFGEVYIRNIFSQLYLCNTAALYEISNNLFDYDVTTLSGVWDDIKKGLEMYGSDPMQCVQGLRFYPFDLTSIFSDISSQNYVYFGAYQLQLQNSSVYKMVYANGYKDLGSVTIKRTFKDWRDFEPYTKLSIYLPYVGRYQLDLKKYYDKTINIRYYLDIRTGACCACLIANGVLLDWFDGLIGTEMPITLTDYSSYAQNQINIIMRNAGIGVAGEGAVGALGVKGVNAAMNYSAGEQGAAFANTYVAQGGGNAAFSAAQSASAAAGKAGAAGVAGSMGLMAAGMGVVALGVAEKTAFDMMRTGTAAYTKGRPGSSAMINNFLPQYPTFMFEIMEIDESPYLNELYGRPSNASGLLGDFSGYLEAEDVMLICPIATDNERQEIIDLVRSGIYI